MSLIHHKKTQITLDTETGLMWQDNNDYVLLGWLDAEFYSKKLNLGGFTDWEIPKVEVLLNLANKSDKYTNSCYYWSSSYAKSSAVTSKMVVNFYYKDLSSSYAGTLDETAKQLRMNHNHVKCVRKRKLSIIDIMSVSNYKLVDKNSKNKLITFCKNLVNLNFNNSTFAHKT